MHILLLPSWYPKNRNDVSGVFFRDQAIALYNHGHKVGVIAPQLRSLRTLLTQSSGTRLKTFENDRGIPTYRKELLALAPRVPYGNYWLYKQVARRLMQQYIIENGKPDILHAHAAIYGGAAGVELSRELQIPLVLTEHSTGFARGIYKKWQLNLAKKAIEASSLCISVSPALGDLLTKQFSTINSRWKWIPNVVADRFENLANKTAGERPIRFLNLALMTKKKGQLDLIQAFSELIKIGMSAELWLAGDGPERHNLELITKNLGIDKKVRFMGLVRPSNIPKLMTEVDIMVISSHYETFGVVAIEALMAGLPVIATRCGGPECILEVGDGLLVPPRQPAALSDAMLQVGKNLANYDPVVIAKRARERFSSEVIACRLVKEYESVLPKKRF